MTGGTVTLPRCGACAQGKHQRCQHPEYVEREDACCCVLGSQSGRGDA